MNILSSLLIQLDQELTRFLLSTLVCLLRKGQDFFTSRYLYQFEIVTHFIKPAYGSCLQIINLKRPL